MKWLIALFLVGCGGPALQNVPAPNPAHVAAGAAAAAGAMTLADPDGAARKAEKNETKANGEVQEVETSPSEVMGALDRAEAANKHP